MENIQKQLEFKQPKFLEQLKTSKVSKTAKRYKITMAASMAV